MKKKLMVGIVLSVFILILIPSIPAIQLNEVKESIKSDFFSTLKNNFDINKNIHNKKIEPQCFAIPYAILTFIILVIIFGIIGTFGTIIAFIVNVVVGAITGFMGIAFTIIKLIINVILTIMSGTISTIGEIFGLFSNWISLLINSISQKFNSVREFVILLIGLVIDVLKLIYDTIFPNIVIN